MPRRLIGKELKLKKLYYFVVIWIIAIITINVLMKSIEPIFEKMCTERAKEIGTKILNTNSSKVLKNINYDDLIIVEKDVNDNIRMVKSNVILINLLSSEITSKIQNEISNLEKQKVKFSIGMITGNRILSGIGPSINLKIVPVGSVETEFKSEFISMGINQTIHRLYLVVDCEINILTPYSTIDSHIENQILFAENMVIGEIPDSYYNLEGIGKEEVLEVVN